MKCEDCFWSTPADKTCVKFDDLPCWYARSMDHLCGPDAIEFEPFENRKVIKPEMSIST